MQALHPRQKRFFYLDNLLAYLHILMEHIPPNTVSPKVLKESTFDGGMGIPQFEPVNYVRYAKDGDNQKPVNIWESIPDASAQLPITYINMAGSKACAGGILFIPSQTTPH